MQTKLFDDVRPVVLYHVEIAVVAVARHVVAVLAVPACMLHADVFSRYHLAVEHHVFRAILFVELLDDAEHTCGKGLIGGVVADLDAQALGSLHQSVHTDGQILAREVDVTRVEERKHAPRLHLPEIFVVGQLHLVGQIGHIGQRFQIGAAATPGLLHDAVQVEREHAFAAGRYTSRPERIAKPVVLYLVAQPAA